MTETNDLTKVEEEAQPQGLLTALYVREESDEGDMNTGRAPADETSADTTFSDRTSAGSDSVDAKLDILQKYPGEHTELLLAGIYVDRCNSEHAAPGSTVDRIAANTDASPLSAGSRNAAREADSVTAVFPEMSEFPEMVRLMQDVRTGKINCVIVRSFTDFGRERMETVYYIENVFRYLNVRFISVEDDFDSGRETDMRRIREFSTERRAAARSQSLSRQRCESAKARAARPDAMPGGSTPYGYLVSEDGKSYVTDQETAPFVRMIFKWAASGLSSPRIAQRMELLGVETPGQRRLGKSPDPSKWDAHVVLKILQNPNYTGDIYIGRMQQALYKSQSRHRTSPDEWVIREHTHEPLVTREDFRRVQEIIASNDRSGGDKSGALI